MKNAIFILASFVGLGCYESDGYADIDTGIIYADTEADAETVTDAGAEDCFVRFDGVRTCECSADIPCRCAEGTTCFFYLLDDDAEIECSGRCLLTCPYQKSRCDFDACGQGFYECSEAVRACGDTCPVY